MEKTRLIICVLAVLGLLLTLIIALKINNTDYIAEIIVFTILTILMFLFYDYLKLNRFTYLLLIISLFLHAFGAFGFYAKSPFNIQYDHITHFAFFFSFGLAFFIFLKKYLPEKSKLILLILIVFFVSSGVGAMVEQVEFLGYLSAGGGKGLFYVGDAGDIGVGALSQIDLREMDAVGGGWLNTGWDVMYNSIGTIFGMLIAVIFFNKGHN